jgi:outer membrane protein assembly factor BamB
VKSNRSLASFVSVLVILGFAIAQAGDQRAKLGETRNVTLPSYAVLDERAQPLLASSGKVGFVASVTGGSVISFSLTSGKILSSVSVGETIGPISMVEAGGRRLIAAPAVNNPGQDSPATVTIIDATSAKRLELKALLVLPKDAQITPGTQALLTRDGRFCLIASSFDVPTLLAFEVETGQLVSHIPLIGRPSELALDDDGSRRSVAVASAVSNTVSIIELDPEGQLSAGASFSPAGARLDETNNPAFGFDGRTLYVAAANGDSLYAVDVESGIQLDSISVPSPQRVSVGADPDGNDVIACSRIRRPANGKNGGVTILTNLGARLAIKTEFAPPDGIEFSPANNVALSADASIAFVGSTTGVLFAFHTGTGEVESYQTVGGELRRVAMSDKARTVAAVRSSPSGDQVVILSFDVVSPSEPEPSIPIIDSIFPDVTEQGRMRNLQLMVAGKNLSGASSLLVNDVEYAADLTQDGRTLRTKLPKALFNQAGSLTVRVKGANGVVSNASPLRVVRPGEPMIDGITPSEVPGPLTPFTIKVTGRNFRASSAISIEGVDLNTRLSTDNQLEARVPAEVANRVGTLKVRVRDLAVTDLVSANEKHLVLFGPRISAVRPSVNKIVAGDGKLSLSITGRNFREGAEVVLGGAVMPADRVRRVSRSLITLSVPQELTQESGTLAVVVRNPEGGVSGTAILPVRGPEITRFRPGKLFAGSSDVAVDIRGRNFRNRARVYVGDGAQLNFPVERQHVRFRNSTRLVVTLTDDLNRLLTNPGAIKFQVVNPNSAEGVRSEDRSINVVGPRIADARVEALVDDDSHAMLVIEGANFRKGAIVEFFKPGMENAPVSQLVPVDLKARRISIMVRVRKIERLGSFRVRVVNQGAAPVASEMFQPRLAELVHPR